jgi:hypothetical protein
VLDELGASPPVTILCESSGRGTQILSHLCGCTQRREFVEHDLHDDRRGVALDFECPSFAPVPAEARQLSKACSGDRDRSTCISSLWQERARDSSADRQELFLTAFGGSLHDPLGLSCS